MAGEEVGVRELPPVRAHLAESLHAYDRAAEMSNALVKSIDEPTSRIGDEGGVGIFFWGGNLEAIVAVECYLRVKFFKGASKYCFRG